MKLYSWNVNGIRAMLKKGLFQTFLKAHQPDVLCLQETKAERGQIEIDVPDYREYWNSAAKKGYSGTADFLASRSRSGSSTDFPASSPSATALQTSSSATVPRRAG